MIALVRSEVRRLRSRRLSKVMLLLAVGGIVLIAGIVFVNAESGLEGARERARAEVARCLQEAERFSQRGTFPGDAPGPRTVDPHAPDLHAEDSPIGIDCPTEEFLVQVYDRRFAAASAIPDTVRVLSIVFALAGFVVAASSVGAEWGHGSIETLLTWEPRRARVLGGRAVAVVGTVTLVAAVLLVASALLLWPSAVFRGTTAGIDGAWWRSLAGTVARGGALTALGAGGALALAFVVRNTAGAVGIGFAYAGMVDPLLGVWRQGRLRPWLFQRNVPQLLGFPVEVERASAPDVAGFAVPTVVRVLPPWRPLAVLGAYVAVLLVVALVTFRRRDVA